MRILLAAALLAFGVNAHGPAHAQGTDTLSCSGAITYPEGQAPASFTLPLDCTIVNTPPVDNPPSATNLVASCDEGVACSGNIGVVDDNGATVSWGSTGLTGFAGLPDGTWSASPVDGDGQGVYGVSCTLDDGVNPPVDCPALSITVNDTITDPDPEPGLNIAVVADLPAGEWVEFGLPWSSLETTGALERNRDNCNRQLDAILGAWNGLAWDGPYLWNFAGGGHGDGCFNGVVRYDMEAGTPEVALPHAPLNMPLLWTYQFDGSGNPTDGWNEPYVTTTPWPACAGLDPNCDLPKADRLANGPTFPADEFLIQEGIGTETYGPLLRPRSSHYYNNLLRDGDWLYLLVGQTYGGTKNDAQVWRYNTTTQAVERLPNRHDGNDQIGNYNANVVKHPDGRILMFSGARVCEADFAAGSYDCSNHSINVTNAATLAWDEGRGGFWAIDTQLDRLVFLQEIGTTWTSTTVVNDPILKKSVIGSAGLCLVPTDTGVNPVIWGDDARLLRWDGTALTEVTGQVGQPATAPGTVLNKWTWNEDLGVCLLAQSWDEGIHAWRPDFSNWQEAGGGDPDPDPDPEPQPGDWTTFAGHVAQPAPFTPAAFDQPIEVQPEAPDYAAACPGPWTDLHYTTNAQVAGSAAQTRGLGGNVRIYLYGSETPYTGKLELDKVQCGEVIGVEQNGHRPALQGDVAFTKTGAGFIVRGIDFLGDGAPAWACYQPTASCPVFVVLHDNRMGGAGLMGDSDPTLPKTYLELRGNFFGPNLDWHGLYLERSIGKLIALQNVFHASGNAGHALKNLANYSRIEGNVFSNVGLDGQMLQRNGKNVVGLFALDHYACTDSIIRGNTFILRTSGNVPTMLTYRGRNAWGNCDKGARQADGSRPLFPPESAEYLDEDRWAEIATAAEDFALGYEVARVNPELFTHLVEGNTFVVIEGKPGTTPAAITIHSMRPIADNTVEQNLNDQMAALITLCNATVPPYDDCWFANASPEVRYVHDHIQENRRAVMRTGNANGRVEVPNSLPIRAPQNWVERTGVYYSPGRTIWCDAAGTTCADVADLPFDISPAPWDAVEVASPPRLLPHTAP